MASPSDPEATRLLRERIARERHDWDRHIRIEDAEGIETVALDVPGHPGHRLSVVISKTEAMVAYSDGLPPGPAEKLLVWGNADVSDGVEAVAGFLGRLFRGDVVLVRERASHFTRILRGDEVDSLLRFESASEITGWPARRRGKIVRAWAWSPDQRLAI